MIEVRIYYDDTDAGGVVYHANYLRYLERGRTELLREHGFSVQAMQEQGISFPVVALEINYRSPGRLDDLLQVETAIVAVRNSSFVAGQKVFLKSDGRLLVEARVTLACVGAGKKAQRLPLELRELLVSLSP